MDNIHNAESCAFTFDEVTVRPSQQIAMHSQNTWELSYVIEGTGRRIIGEARDTITPGEIILIPPGIPHCWEFDCDSRDAMISNITVTFSERVLRLLPGIFPEFTAVADGLRHITDACFIGGGSAAAIAAHLESMRSLTAEARLPVMLKILSLLARSDSNISLGRFTSLTATERKLNRIRAFCWCNFMRQVTLDELSRHTGTNKSALCTFLRRHCGTTFTRYINDLRLEKAAELLTDRDESVSAAAYTAGFTSVPYFNRLFRQKYGCSPRQWRSTDI